jgi:hypothetical protein
MSPIVSLLCSSHAEELAGDDDDEADEEEDVDENSSVDGGDDVDDEDDPDAADLIPRPGRPSLVSISRGSRAKPLVHDRHAALREMKFRQANYNRNSFQRSVENA